MGKPKRLKSVDLRASWARRHKELAAAFAADLGAGLTEADRAVIDFAAVVAIEAERMKARQLNGGDVDLEELVRLANALTRIRRELGAKAASAKQSARPLTFQERMEARRRKLEAEEANKNDDDL